MIISLLKDCKYYPSLLEPEKFLILDSFVNLSFQKLQKIMQACYSYCQTKHFVKVIAVQMRLFQSKKLEHLASKQIQKFVESVGLDLVYKDHLVSFVFLWILSDLFSCCPEEQYLFWKKSIPHCLDHSCVQKSKFFQLLVTISWMCL